MRIPFVFWHIAECLTQTSFHAPQYWGLELSSQLYCKYCMCWVCSLDRYTHSVCHLHSEWRGLLWPAVRDDGWSPFSGNPMMCYEKLNTGYQGNRIHSRLCWNTEGCLWQISRGWGIFQRLREVLASKEKTARDNAGARTLA